MFLVLRLSYELELTSGGIDIGGTSTVRFAEESLKFECSYPRVVAVEAVKYNVTSFSTQSIKNHGFLNYEMHVDVGEVGDITTVTISPQHSLESTIFAKLIECKITEETGDRTIYPIHSFNGEKFGFQRERKTKTGCLIDQNYQLK